jgi:hypothetical protein
MPTLDGCEAQPATDPANCGGCGTACVVSNATAGCASSQCTVGACDTGYTDCDQDATNGCEVNTAANPKACGSCTNDCTTQPGTWTCENGSCKISQCPAGKGECDGNAATVCETDVTNSTLHCGFCNNPCSLPNATGECKASACAIKSCDPGFADCDQQVSNGCQSQHECRPLRKCDRPCSNSNVGTAVCSAGVCTSTCSPGYGNCVTPAQPAADDGCETNLLTDPAHCGQCSGACSATNVTTKVCAAGKCTPVCNTGFGDCNAGLSPAPNDGCETPVSTVPELRRLRAQCGSQNVASTACSAGGAACEAP